MEKSFKRVEDAAENPAHLNRLGILEYHPDDEALGKDGHTIIAELELIEQFIDFI